MLHDTINNKYDKVKKLIDEGKPANEVKKEREVTIEEVIVAEEKVVFKLPKELN